MGKNTCTHRKNRPTSYESSSTSRSNSAQSNETPADSESDSDKCEHCDDKQADQLLQCESCKLWFCCACQRPAGMMIALTSYKSLHWCCKTCEPTVVSKLSNLDSVTTTAADLSDNIGKKIEDSVAKA